jgi:uncharacterized repeat protein (TIGR03803 family)
LHSFTATSTPDYPYTGTNNDGTSPLGGLILSGKTLYGTTGYGGFSGSGTVFAINTISGDFTNLHSFARVSNEDFSNTDGVAPYAALALSGNTLYGTAIAGGSFSDGTVFSLSFRPQLNIMTSGTNAILTWPANLAGFDYTGYTLRSTTNIVSTSWAIVSPSPILVNGQMIVTNAITGTKMFYQLIQ